MIFHQVQSGETLSSIARDYDTTVANLINYNGIPNPENLAVGQCIVIVYPTSTYKVQAGDTLYSIAEETGISINQLYRNNPQLSALPNVYPGENLVLSLEDDKIGAFQTGGYTYTNVSDTLIREQMPFMNYLMPFTYGFKDNGELIPADDERLIQIAHTYNTACFLHLSTLAENGEFSNKLANNLLEDIQKQEILINNCLEIIQSKGYDGLDVDFEFVYAEDAEKYAEFIERAKNILSPYGYEVFAALAPKTDDNQKGLLYEGHLYREIGEAASAVLLMTYEWGYTYTR